MECCFSHLAMSVPSLCKIGYLPIIDGSPTDLSIVNAILCRSIDIADKLDQDSIVLVMDEAVYAKAQMICWTDAVYQVRLVLRLGEFHVIMSFLKVIGKQFKDGGLQDVLIESNVIAVGSVNGVLTGKHYNRSLRSMKIVYEAIYHVVIAAQLDSVSNGVRELVRHVMQNLHAVFNDGTFNQVSSRDNVQKCLEKLNHFIRRQSEESLTFAYWMTFLKMVDILLQFVRATRFV